MAHGWLTARKDEQTGNSIMVVRHRVHGFKVYTDTANRRDAVMVRFHTPDTN
jgi:hypothetical protein